MINLEIWLEALGASTQELATVALGFDGSEIIGISDSLKENMNAAYIPLVGEEESMQLGVAATKENCQALSRAIMCMESDEPDLEDADVADAIGEVVNILAGQVKRELSEKGVAVNLGIPIFIDGHIQETSQMSIKVIDAKIGHIDISLLILESIKSARASFLTSTLTDA